MDGRGAIVPSTQKARSQLEREADVLLQDAYGELMKTSKMNHQGGIRVLSLDDSRSSSGLYPETPVDASEEVADVLDSLWEARLSSGEEIVTEAILDGSVVPGVKDGFHRVAVKLGTSTANARARWFRAKAKIQATWAVSEDAVRPPKRPLAASKEGNGFPLVIGLPRRWGRPVTADDAREALVSHWLYRVKETDWRHKPSLRPDGWQLSNDDFWGAL
jgi:hypothetical protein